MNISIIGSGGVAQAIGSALINKGHQVTLSAREASKPEAVEWATQSGGSVVAFSEVSATADIYLNCTAGMHSLAALQSVGVSTLAGKVLVDVANPLDFSNGFPPTLSVCNDLSLAEQIQVLLPTTNVVKALNTVANSVMVNPDIVPGRHHLPIAGNDSQAKAKVIGLLGEFGWSAEQIVDLGDISQARGTEMYLALWVRMFGKFGTPNFNIQWQVGK